MKKQAKGIIALSALLVALLGGGYAYTKFAPGEGGDIPAEPTLLATVPDGSGTVLVSDNGQVGTVKKVHVINSEGEMTVVMKNSPAEDEDPVYTLEGYTDLKLKELMISTLANNGNGIEAQNVVARDCGDISKYGLDKPEATVEMTYESGNKVKFYVGDTAPTNDGVYFMVDGTKDVYMVPTSKVLNYSNSVKDFVDTTILDDYSDGSQPRVESLRVARTDMDSDILVEYDVKSEDAHSGGTSSSHKMVLPTESYLNVELSSKVITGMFGLTASDLYVLHCTDADIKEAGLSEPFCRVDMECEDGDKYTLLLSEVFTNNSGTKCCYGMLEGGNTIYIIPSDRAPWLTVQPIDIATRMLINAYVWNITDMTVSGSGEKAEFVIKPADSDNKPDNPSSSDFSVTLNGKVFDSERYRKFYSFLAGTNAEEFALGVPVPDGEPNAVIKYSDSYTGKTMTYEFYEDSVMRSLIVVNGESKYYCTKSYVSVLLDNIRRIDTDEDFVTRW